MKRNAKRDMSGLFGIFMVLFLILLMRISPVVAADEVGADDTAVAVAQDEEVGDEVSSFSNPTQVQRAANLAEAVASQPNQEVEAALAMVAQAEEDLAAAVGAEDQEAQDVAAEALAAARQNADTAMAENSGVTADDIAAMREQGMGWGEIAHELGVHPGTLGLGHAKAFAKEKGRADGAKGNKEKERFRNQEVRAATARNFRTGFSKGHGVNTGDKAGGKGLGLDRAGKKGKASAAAGGKGPGGGKGGGGGGGKGGGKGGGNGGGKGK